MSIVAPAPHTVPPAPMTSSHAASPRPGSPVAANTGRLVAPLDEPMNNPLLLLDCDWEDDLDAFAGFRSAHAGGCFFLFCDGSVRFVTEGVDARTYRALSTIGGGEAVTGEF